MFEESSYRGDGYRLESFRGYSIGGRWKEGNGDFGGIYLEYKEGVLGRF